MIIPSKRMKVSLSYIGFAFLFAIAMAGFYYYAIYNGSVKNIVPSDKDLTTTIPQNDTPPAPQFIPVEEALVSNYAESFGMAPEQIKISIEKQTDKFVSGKVTMPDYGEQKFIAKAMGNDFWTEVYTGTDVPPCDTLKMYSVPIDFASECLNDSTDTIEKR